MTETNISRQGPKPRKRRWTTPRVTSTQAAFEHAILACNGATRSGGALHQNSGGPCTVVATANS